MGAATTWFVAAATVIFAGFVESKSMGTLNNVLDHKDWQFTMLLLPLQL